MAFIKENLDDVQESHPVAEGEYELTIMKAEEKESKKGNDMIVVSIRIEGEPEASLLNHWLLSPEGAEPEIARLRKLEFKRFCAVFELPTDCEAADMPGQKGTCLLTQDEGDDGITYNRLRLPRLKD